MWEPHLSLAPRNTPGRSEIWEQGPQKPRCVPRLHTDRQGRVRSQRQVVGTLWPEATWSPEEPASSVFRRLSP